MKIFFFTALVAIVVVGGSYANHWYTIGLSTNPYSCPPGEVTCDIKYSEANNPMVSPYKFSENPYQPDQYYLSSVPWDGFN